MYTIIHLAQYCVSDIMFVSLHLCSMQQGKMFLFIGIVMVLVQGK